jgi:hypothetical protein
LNLRQRGLALGPIAILTACLAAPAVPTPNAPGVRSIHIENWGLPGDPRFRVTISAEGTLISEREEYAHSLETFRYSRDDTLSVSRAFELPQAELPRLLAMAVAALADFEQGCRNVYDGSSATLVVIWDSSEDRRTCLNAGPWPVGPASHELVTSINGHLPSHLRIPVSNR